MKIPFHVKIRKKLRSLLYKILGSFFKNTQTQHNIDPKKISSIVIVRPNYRIGNLIFLTPLINELYKIMPHAKIDIIVGMKIAGNILEPMPNVNSVIDIPRKLLLHPIELYSFIKNIRQTKYDLALNITAGSLSSEIVTALLNATYKASYENEKTIIPLTHTVKETFIFHHAGSRPLELLKLFQQNLPKKDIQLDIKLSQTEQKQAHKEFQALLQNIETKSYIITLFRNARFDKKIADHWWNQWHQELLKIDNNIVLIDILSPDIIKKLNENTLEYSNKNLRLLGAFFKESDLYISADTGPLHISSASGAKTLGLFNKTDIKKFGVFGKNNLSLDITQLSPKEVAIMTYKHLQKES